MLDVWMDLDMLVDSGGVGVLCFRAAKLAIREEIQRDMEREKLRAEAGKKIPSIDRLTTDLPTDCLAPQSTAHILSFLRLPSPVVPRLLLC